ncbi:MAG: OmpA family protein [Geminicoccaceae bacterium]
MYRNMTGASSALAILALLAGTPATGLAQEGSSLCNALVDGDGDPVRESDSDDVGHSNSSDCPSEADARTVENTEAKQETAAVSAPPPVVDPLIVYFDVNQDDLDAGAGAEVNDYVTELMATSPTSLAVVGFTDTSGPTDLNARLSESRADSVATALIEAGVPAGMIQRGASGESSPAIDTPDGTREANNRRVTVTPAY